jgi:hypothetical protein
VYLRWLKHILPVAALAAIAVPQAAALEAFYVSFTGGSPEGTLPVDVTECAYLAAGGHGGSGRGGDCLVMDRKGVSEVRGRFSLSEVPRKLYIRLDHATSSSPENPPPTFELGVNDRLRVTVVFTSDAFITTAQDITDYVHQGENTFVLKLADGAETNQYLRRIDVVPIASLTEAVEKARGTGGAVLRTILAILGTLAIAFSGSALWRTVWNIFWGGHGGGAGAATLLTFILCGLAALVWFVICLGFALKSLGWGVVAAVSVCIFMALLERAVGEMR